MRSTRLGRALVLGTVSGVMALTAGCGGNDRLSREELVSQGDAICDEYDERIQQVEDPQSVEDVERFVNESKPIVEEGVNELRALEPPEDLEEQYEEWVSENEAAVAVLDDLRQAAAAADETRVQEVAEEAQQTSARANRLAEDIGFERCGN